jgi:hypothetical protein
MDPMATSSAKYIYSISLGAMKDVFTCYERPNLEGGIR